MSAATSTSRRHRSPAALIGPVPGPAARPVPSRRAGELTVEIVRGAGATTVVATGCLGREGGELLAALIAHAEHRDGGAVTVDLRQVSHAEPLGVAALRDAATVVGGLSAVVGHELGALVR
jgi:hypothetical protein